MSLNDYSYTGKYSKIGYRRKDGFLSVTDLKGSGRYVKLNERERRELALVLLSTDYDAHFHPGLDGRRQIGLVEKQKPLRAPEVGEFYRIPGRPDMCDPWRDSPVARVKTANSPGYIILETLGGDQTGWSNIRALGEPLEVKVQTEWVVEG